MSMWTEKWPTQPGWHWYYGWCFRSRSREPAMHLVKVRKIRNSLMLVTDEHFLYQAEGGYGVWLPAQLPEPPPDFEEHEQQ